MATAAIDYSAFSANESEALSQFRRQYNRAPTAEEVAAYRGQLPSAAAPAAAAGAASSNYVDAFGGDSLWESLQAHSLSSTSYKDMGLSASGDKDSPLNDSLLSGATGALTSMKGSLAKMSSANESMLKGEIPADVSASVRRAASENSIMRGVGGQAGRALSARDLGLSSMDIKQKGIENEGKLAEMRRGMADSYDKMRTWSKTYDAGLRELEIKARAENTTAISHELDRAKFNAQRNVDLVKILGDLVSNQQSVAGTLAGNDIDPAGSMASFQQYIDSIIQMMG